MRDVPVPYNSPGHAKHQPAYIKNQNLLQGFICPITLQLPDPDKSLTCVVDGQIYDRSSIIEWVKRNKCSPLTREHVELTDLMNVRESRLLLRPRTTETLKALKAAGFDPKKAKRQNFDAIQCKAAGYSISEMQRSGFSRDDLVKAYAVSELHSFSSLEWS